MPKIICFISTIGTVRNVDGIEEQTSNSQVHSCNVGLLYCEIPEKQEPGLKKRGETFVLCVPSGER